LSWGSHVIMRRAIMFRLMGWSIDDAMWVLFVVMHWCYFEQHNMKLKLLNAFPFSRLDISLMLLRFSFSPLANILITIVQNNFFPKKKNILH
jgi:hypothetical protein